MHATAMITGLLLSLPGPWWEPTAAARPAVDAPARPGHYSTDRLARSVLAETAPDRALAAQPVAGGVAGRPDRTALQDNRAVSIYRRLERRVWFNR